jgi:hypothetical protein
MFSKEEVLGVRKDMIANGYSPVRVVSGGKRPVATSWSAGDEGVLSYGAGAPNTGMLTAGLRVVDVDLDDDHDDASASTTMLMIELILPAGQLIRRRSNSVRFQAIFRAAEGAPTKVIQPLLNGKIEVLGAGQQTVVHGRHPTGAEFFWDDNRAPWTVPYELLPALSEEELQGFLNDVAYGFGVPAAAVKPMRADNRTSESKPAADVGDESWFDNMHYFDLIETDRKDGILRKLLALVNPNDVGVGKRETWRNTVWACLATEAPHAREIIHEWCEKWPGYTSRGDVDAVINSDRRYRS